MVIEDNLVFHRAFSATRPLREISWLSQDFRMRGS